MAYSGNFRPRNPQKYIGDHTKIIWRSTWERRVMTWLDEHDEVIAWGSEELVIPYVSPVDGKYHRYFPDMIAKMKNRQGKLQTFVIEIKPHKQTKEPAPRKRKTRQYITEVATYAVNVAKWKAAEEYCLDRGWQFIKMTEENNPWMAPKC